MESKLNSKKKLTLERRELHHCRNRRTSLTGSIRFRLRCGYDDLSKMREVRGCGCDQRHYGQSSRRQNEERSLLYYKDVDGGSQEPSRHHQQPRVGV